MASNYGSKVIAVVGLGISGVSLLTYFYYKHSKKQEIEESIPTKWRQVGTLEEIHFYPIKSCAPVELDQALCENLGIQHRDVRDRALMIIENNGKLITARAYPKMLLIVSKIVDHSKLIITAPGMEDLNFDYKTLVGGRKYTKAVIYGYTARVKDCGEKCNSWFSTYILGKPDGLVLVYYPYEQPTRPVDELFQNGIFAKKDTGTFQDVSSYHLINNESVKDLNSRLERKVYPRQFRANFYVNGESPYEEDNWQWIRIGDDLVLRNIAPCFRCILPNINPFTAERDPDCQPLKTLQKYRMDPNSSIKSPIMGVQLGLRSIGTVKKGDAVFVEELSSLIKLITRNCSLK